MGRSCTIKNGKWKIINGWEGGGIRKILDKKDITLKTGTMKNKRAKTNTTHF